MYERYITHHRLDSATQTFVTLRNENSLHSPIPLCYVFFEWPRTNSNLIMASRLLFKSSLQGHVKTFVMFLFYRKSTNTRKVNRVKANKLAEYMMIDRLHFALRFAIDLTNKRYKCFKVL